MIGVEDSEITRLAAELGAGRALFAGRRRRRAADRLAELRTPAAVRALAMAYADGGDLAVAAIAQETLTHLENQTDIDSLCEAVIATGSPRLAALVSAAAYRHSDPNRRALLLFLTGQFDAYAELDFDGSALTAAHTTADESLRARLAERARESGRVEWVRMATDARRRDATTKLSDVEWESAIGILAAAGRLTQLWSLAPQATPTWAVRILSELDRHGWRPDIGLSRADYRELTELARCCSGDPAKGYHDAPQALPGFGGKINRLVTTPDGTLLAAAGKAGGVRLWGLPAGDAVGTLADGHWFDLAVFPEGDRLAGSKMGEAQLWRLPSGHQIAKLRISERAEIWSNLLTVTPDGEVLIGNGGSGCYRWRPPWEGKAEKIPDKATYHTVMSTSDGTYLVGGRYDLVRFTRLPAGTETVTARGHQAEIRCVVGTPDARLAATGASDGEIRLWRVPPGELAGVLTGHTGRVDHLVVTPDGRLLASGGKDGTLRLWRLPSGEPAGVLTGHEKPVTALAVRPDGKLLASGDEGGTIRLWRLPSGAPAGVLTDHGARVTSMVITPDGGSLASGDGRGGLWLRRLWHPELTAVCGAPVRELRPNRLDALRETATSTPEREWIRMISALVRWRHRHDIEVGDTTRSAGSTDIEVSDR